MEASFSPERLVSNPFEMRGFKRTAGRCIVLPSYLQKGKGVITPPNPLPRGNIYNRGGEREGEREEREGKAKIKTALSSITDIVNIYLIGHLVQEQTGINNYYKA